MPLPKIRDGQKLSLTLPYDVVLRIKHEALEDRTIPSLIVLEALDQYWGENSEASDPTTIPSPEKKRDGERLLSHLETLVLEAKLTVDEIATAAKASREDVQHAWHKTGYVPLACLGPVALLLAQKKLPLSPKE